MAFEGYGKTDVGKVRSNNQDNYALGELVNGSMWAVVCDGMGGANGGNTASSIAAEQIKKAIIASYRENMRSKSICNLLETAINAANAIIYEKSLTDMELSGMGTTVVAAIFTKETVHIAHVGDSRAYVVGKNKISQLTTDHSMVQMMVESGKITLRQARNHPQKNVITRAVGVSKNIDIDYCEYKINEEEIFLLCSDGLSNCLEDNEILMEVNCTQFDKLPARLIELANENGGSDNITAITVKAN